MQKLIRYDLPEADSIHHIFSHEDCETIENFCKLYELTFNKHARGYSIDVHFPKAGVKNYCGQLSSDRWGTRTFINAGGWLHRKKLLNENETQHFSGYPLNPKNEAGTYLLYADKALYLTAAFTKLANHIQAAKKAIKTF